MARCRFPRHVPLKFNAVCGKPQATVTIPKRKSSSREVAKGASKNRCSSENNLRRQLQVEGLARTKSWRSVEVTDGVTHGPVSTHRSCASRQVLAIEQVEHFRAELQFRAFRDGDILDYRQVYIGKARALEGIAAEVAVRVGGSRAT